MLICVQPGDHRQAIREALIARRSLDAGMGVIALRFCTFLDCDSDVENLPSLVPSVCRRSAKLRPDVHFLNGWIAQGASAQYALMTCSLPTPNPFSLLLEKAGMIPIVDGPACSFCERRCSWTLKPQSSYSFADWFGSIPTGQVFGARLYRGNGR